VERNNHLADPLSRKFKYSLDSREEQDFIPHNIDPTEDNTEPQDTSITTNNLLISPIPEEFTMVSHGCINFKFTDCDYNKCAGRKESLTTILSRKKCNQMRIPSAASPKKSLPGVSSILTTTFLNMIN